MEIADAIFPGTLSLIIVLLPRLCVTLSPAIHSEYRNRIHLIQFRMGRAILRQGAANLFSLSCTRLLLLNPNEALGDRLEPPLLEQIETGGPVVFNRLESRISDRF